MSNFELNIDTFHSAVAEAIRLYPESIKAITFLATAIGPTGQLTQEDHDWAMYVLCTP